MRIIVEILEKYLLQCDNQFSNNLSSNFENYVLELYKNKSIDDENLNILKKILNYYKINNEKFNNNFLYYIFFIKKNIEFNNLCKKRKRRYSSDLLSQSGDISKPLEGLTINDFTLEMFLINLGIHSLPNPDQDMFIQKRKKDIIFK